MSASGAIRAAPRTPIRTFEPLIRASPLRAAGIVTRIDPEISDEGGGPRVADERIAVSSVTSHVPRPEQHRRGGDAGRAARVGIVPPSRGDGGHLVRDL